MRVVRIPLILAGWLCLAAAAAADRLVVGVENIDYRPYQDGHTGVFRGFGRELLDAFAADEGLAIQYLPLPPTRLLASLLQGRVDFKYPDDPGWRADLRAGHQIHYSRPVVGYVDGTLVLPERLGQPQEGIRTLGTVVGFTPVAWRDRLEANMLTLRENADFAALFQQVVTRRVDAAYANVAVAREQSGRILGHPHALRFDPALPSARGHYRVSTLRHRALLERFDLWLERHAARVDALKQRAGLSASALD